MSRPREAVSPSPFQLLSLASAHTLPYLASN